MNPPTPLLISVGTLWTLCEVVGFNLFILMLFCSISGGCACRSRPCDSVKAHYDLCFVCAPFMIIPVQYWLRFPHDTTKTNQCLSLWESGQMLLEGCQFPWQCHSPFYCATINYTQTWHVQFQYFLKPQLCLIWPTPLHLKSILKGFYFCAYWVNIRKRHKFSQEMKLECCSGWLDCCQMSRWIKFDPNSM